MFADSHFKYYNWFILTIIFLIFVADLELYKYWGFRLDITPILYLKTPKEAAASVSVWVIISKLLLAGALIAGSGYAFKKIAPLNFYKADKSILGFFVYVLIFLGLIIPIRGGLGIAPINVGSAYFSQKSFLNHAAINVLWNLGNSFANLNDGAQVYHYFEDVQCDNLIKPYLNTNDTSGSRFLNANQPNIVLIMLESFTANVVEPLGGISGITPNFNNLSKEGILFTNIYAAGDRSDKGLMAILSGYPAQTTFSVIKDAAKTQSLPKFPYDLKLAGYNTTFYYGGDPDFANMRSYLISAGFNKLITKENFPRSSYNSKWGAHDEVVFQKLLEDLKETKSPFFKMIFTLSSHEPFEVPGKTVIQGDDLTSKFLNSLHYTDKCLGDFIQHAKQQKWWNNTLIILVADHGIRIPGNLKAHEAGKFHIPMLWIGGAISKDTIITKTASQTDIATTVLNQLGINSSKYLFSRNVFGERQQTDAFYIFNNGIGMVNDSMKLVYDFSLKSVLKKEGNISDSLVNTSKAYIQRVYQDIQER